jgi:hypothetical protein
MNMDDLSEDQLLEMIKQATEENNNKLDILYKKMTVQLAESEEEKNEKLPAYQTGV